MPTTQPDDLPPSARRRAPRRPRPATGDSTAEGRTAPATSDATDRLPTVERTSVLEAGDEVSPALDRLSGVRGATLAPLVGVHRVGSGFALTHAVPADAETLAVLRAATPLRSGHVVTVLTAVAEALVVLHDAGLAHGCVDAEHLLVAPDGSVVLVGSGLAWSRPPGAPDGPQPEDDIAAAAELIRHLLGAGSASSGLVLLGLRAGDPDPVLRPDAASLLESVRRCGRAAPLLDLLWLTDRGPQPARSTHDEGTGPPAPPVDDRDATWSGIGGGDTSLRRTSTREDVGPERSARGRRRDDRPARPRRRPYAPVAVLASLVVAVGGALAVRAAGGVASASETVTGSSSSLSIAGPRATPSSASSPGSTGRPGGSSPDPVMPATPTSLDDRHDIASRSPAPDVASTGSSVIDVDRGAAPPPAWSTVLRQVDAGRLRAIAAGSVGDLADYVDPAGPAFAADSALALRVAASGAALRGGVLQVLGVRTLSSTASRTVLRVRDRRAAYSVEVDGSSSAVAARAPRWWQVTLARGLDGRWRIFDVTTPGDAGAGG